MKRTFNARVFHGLLEPLAPVDLPPEGSILTITVEDEPTGEQEAEDPLDLSFGAWRDLVDCEQLKENIYKSRNMSITPD